MNFCDCVSPAAFVWILVFLSVCINSCACACVSQCLYGLLCLRLRFSVFVWTFVLVSQCLCGPLCLRFSVFVWTVALAFLSVSKVNLVLAFLSVCIDSCACACVSH